MIVEIKNVKYIRDKCYGIARFISKNRILIEVSKSLNNTIGEYASTLLHELLHVWVAIVKINGGSIDRRKEHKFIYQVERDISKRLTIMRRQK